MNARQWLLTLLVAASVAIAGCQKPTPLPSPESAVKAATVVLGLTGDGICSGTMISPTILLSAHHCFVGDRLLTVNQVPVNVLDYRHDGNDHAVLTLDTEFPAFAPVNWDGMAQGDRVFMYGNPQVLDLLRRGYVTGSRGMDVLLDMPISGGDSGAAVFNERGEIVGVLSGYGQFQSGMMLGLVRAFNGRPDTWALAIED